MTIPEIAGLQINKILSQADENTARTIFLVGSKSVGKTTLLYSFLEKTDIPRETLVLEYFFSRKTNQKQGVEKTICHLWEYGGKLEHLKEVLPCVPIYGKGYFCIMLDLSKPKSLWFTLETAIKYINETTAGKSGNNSELIIICGKYDFFKNYDSEIKKHVCATLRSVALLCNAHLLFYTHKEQQLVKRAKDLFSNIAFGSDIIYKEKNVTNYSKPIMIAKGSDSWESISIAASTLEQIKTRHIFRFKPDINEDDIKTAEAVVNTYPEPTLDSLAALKMEEFYNMNKNVIVY